MDNNKVGQLISDIRKEKSMTQKELAELLNVTDKAVSKWERGNGYPDISILPSLANVLDISISELLSGQRKIKESTQECEADIIVSDTIEYMEKVNRRNVPSLVVALLSAVFLFSLLVCLLCNYAISRRFDWSLYPAGALAVVWLTIVPYLLLKRHRALLSLAGMTISSVPYLFLVEYLCPSKGWVVPLALPITGISVVSLLIVAILFSYTKINKLYITAIIFFLFGVIVNLSVKTVVDTYLGQVHNDISAVITALSFTFASVVTAIAGYIKNKKS